MATNNLTIENLSRVIDTGDAAGLMGAGGGVNGPSSPAFEARVVREMQNNGMDVPPELAEAKSGMPGSARDAANTFGGMLQESMSKVNQHQHEADRAIKELVAGKSKNIHETMLTIERADSSLKLMMAVRNKILDAYKEIMRMQV